MIVTRVRRVFVGAAFAALLAALPAQAVGPLALLAREIVKELVRSILEDAIHRTLIATLGPCDGALASSALTTVQSLVPGRSAALPPGLPGGAQLPAVPQGFAAPSGAAGGAVAGAVGTAAVGAAAGGALGAGIPGLGLHPADRETKAADLPPFLREIVDRQQRDRLADQRARGLTAQQIEQENREEAEQHREMLQSLREMRQGGPLSGQEIDQFVERYGRLAKLMPGEAACSPESLRRLLTLTPVAMLPMTAGPIRAINRALADMDQQFDEARRTYAAMTKEERAEHVALMAEQLEEWDEEPRQVFAAMVRNDILGMPADMREALLAKLAATK